MKAIKHFLIIDDDRQNNFLTEMALKKSFAAVTVMVFMDPTVALQHIENNFPLPSAERVTIILDINMPTMSGWEFIEKLKTLPDSITEQFSIYMLSSSIDPTDISLLICITLLNDDL
mgnify:CR=1 FL=1